jgi:hypothetical protein
MSSKVRKMDQTEQSSTQQGEFEKDYSPFWKSDLFHPGYLRNDIPEIFRNVWSEGEEGSFGLFCNAFHNLSEKYESDEFPSWSERTTIRNWITPVLEMLGYCETGPKAKDLFLEDEPFTYEGRTQKPNYIIVNRSSDLKFIQEKS